MRSLAASLGEHPMAMLRGIAELRGLPLTTNIREEVAEQLAAFLSQPGACGAVLASLSPAAQSAWTGLAAVGGRMKVPMFVRNHGAIRPIGPGKLEREMIWRQPANATEELWYNGLIFRAFADFGSGPLEYFYIPDELRPPASGSASSVAASVQPLFSDQIEVAGHQPFNALAVDACTLLAVLRDNPWRVDTQGGWRAADEAQLRPSLLVLDPVRLALLLALAEAEGWIARERGRLSVQAPAAMAWLRTPAAWEQAKVLFEAWRSSITWNDLRRVPSLRAEGAWRNDPVLARRVVLDALSMLETGRWYRIGDLVNWIKTNDPDFQRPEGNYTDWYLRDAENERYLSGFESWNEVEGRLLAFIVQGPLHWLGMVDLGRVLPDGTAAFSLTAVGADWIAGRDQARIVAPAFLSVSDNFEVTAPLLVPLFDRFRLLRFTEPLPESAVPREVTRHRISRHSLGDARVRGLTGDKILHFLKRATGGKLPARVEAGLRRWSEHSGSVHLSKGAVLRVTDASTLAILRADAVVGPLLGDLLSAQAALVREANIPRLLAALAELGYAAQVD